MELHHSSEQEASEKVTKLFPNKPLVPSSAAHLRGRMPAGGCSKVDRARPRNELLWPALDSCVRLSRPQDSAAFPSLPPKWRDATVVTHRRGAFDLDQLLFN